MTMGRKITKEPLSKKFGMLCKIEKEYDDLQDIETPYLVKINIETTYKMLKLRNFIV